MKIIFSNLFLSVPTLVDSLSIKRQLSRFFFKVVLTILCIYSTSAYSLSESSKLLASDGTFLDEFGYSVSISGNTALIGAQRDDDNGTDSGSAYVYIRDGAGVWTQQAKLLASDGTAGDLFGYSVSINGDTALIGATSDDDNGSNSGSAYVFTRDGAGVWTQQAKLLASDGVASDSFGRSVSIDGDTALVGVEFHSDNGVYTGSAYVFTRDGAGVWTQQTELSASDGAGNDRFGYSVSINGNTALVGAYDNDDNGNYSGSAYVFTRNGAGVWTEQSKLLASDAAAGDTFGRSVSINGDTALIGAYGDDDNGSYSGSSYVFTRDGAGVWAQQAKLLASDGATDDYFGVSVSINGDTALIGAYKDDDSGSSSGSAYLYTRDGAGTWVQQNKLFASDAAANNSFGRSVSIDGVNALIGAYGDDNGFGSGSSYNFNLSDGDGDGVFDYVDNDDDNDGMPDSFEILYSLDQLDAADAALDSDTDGHDNLAEFHAGTDPTDAADNPDTVSNLHYKILANDGDEADEFGYNVSISGNTVLIGARKNDDNGSSSGSAYIYVRDGAGVWTQQAKLLASDGATDDYFGVSVSISGDTAVIGATGDDENNKYSLGSAYVFTRDGAGVWTQQAKLLASDGATEDYFGNSVSIDGDTVLISAYFDDDNGSYSGSVYVYARDGAGIWTQQAKLLASDGATDDRFGVAVSINGESALIGAHWDDDDGSYSGSAYVFTRDGAGVWTQQAKLLASDGAADDQFGASVSINGDTALIGASGNDDNGLSSGSAYVFTRDGAGVWTQQVKLLANDGVSSDRFGGSVSTNGYAALIGANWDDDNGIISGSTYVFISDAAGNWTQQTKLLASDGVERDFFGRSVSIDGVTALIGADGDDDNGSTAGSSYIFSLDLGEDYDGDGVIDTFDLDDDNDGMPDSFELFYSLNPLDASDAVLDSDNDGFDNLAEYNAGTDPSDALFTPDDIDGDGLSNAVDSDDDNDGMSDSFELLYSLNPIDASDAVLDGDSDGFDNLAEFNASSDPTNVLSIPDDIDGDGLSNAVDPDDDNDGMSDSFELLYSLNPLDAADAALDGDNDAFSNLAEYNAGSDPTDILSLPDDIDGDGLSNVVDPDDDNDGMLDSFELLYSLDPLDESDAALDGDSDGFDNLAEFNGGSDPTNILSTPDDNDSDGLIDFVDPDDDNDGMPDSFELLYSLDPFDETDASLDGDGDGYDNLAESNSGSNPNDASSTPLTVVSIPALPPLALLLLSLLTLFTANIYIRKVG